MEIQDIIRLVDWFDDEAEELIEAYTELTNVLQNNSQQANQLPVSEPLKSLVAVLEAMSVEQISVLQFRVLEQFDISDLLGKMGAKWIEQIVKTGTYDPATTFQASQKALQNIRNARKQLNAFKSASSVIGIERDDYTAHDQRFLVNVIFQADASISNVRDWKKMAADWDQIVVGLSAAVGERPEDITVVGVSNGSIILTLGATAAVTKLLATITKHITGIAHDILSVRVKAEELRQSKMMTVNMEKEFALLEKERRENGILQISKTVDADFPEIAPEDRTKLDKSIKKALTFGEAGGEVDFVVPEDEEDGEEGDGTVLEELSAIRELVEDQQKTRQEVKLLEKYQD